MNLYQRLRLWHRAYRYARHTEPHEIAVVRSLVKPGDTVVDIGAHKAAFAWWMARGVGSRGHVVGFEPIPELARYMRDVANNYRDGRLKLIEAALSDHQGEATLHFAGHHLGGASIELTDDVMRPPIRVKLETLDDALAAQPGIGPVSFIKCDVEGHELAVFRGGQGVLVRDQPVILFESTNLRDNREHCERVFAYLRSLGYEGYFFAGSELVPLARFDARQYVPPVGNQNYVFSHPRRVTWKRLARPYVAEYRPRLRVAA